MNIGFPTFGCDGGKSGIGRYALSLIYEMTKQATDNRIELVVHDSEATIFAQNGTKATALRKSDALQGPIKNILWHLTSLPSICRDREWDLLFLPAGNRRVCIPRSCPVVGTVHDLSAMHVQGKYDPVRDFYIKSVLPKMIHRLTHIITVSHSSKSDIVKYCKVPEDRVSVIPLAADTRKFHLRDRDEVRRRVKKVHGIDQPFILYVSRLEHPGKNHIRLIKAFSLLKADGLPHKLILAGSDWTKAKLIHEETAACRYSDDIQVLGFVNEKTLPDLYSAADVLAFPSLYEGFGLPILEAMASGTPVVCSDCSSMPEISGSAAIHFDPLSIEAIANSIRTVLTDSEQWQSMRKKGLERSSEFSWESTAQQTLDVFRRTIDEWTQNRNGLVKL